MEKINIHHHMSNEEFGDPEKKLTIEKETLNKIKEFLNQFKQGNLERKLYLKETNYLLIIHFQFGSDCYSVTNGFTLKERKGLFHYLFPKKLISIYSLQSKENTLRIEYDKNLENKVKKFIEFIDR